MESTLAHRGRVCRGRALAGYFVVLGAPSRPRLLNMGCSFGYNPPWGLVLKGASWLCALRGLNGHAQACTYVQTSLCVCGLTCREMCSPSGDCAWPFPASGDHSPCAAPPSLCTDLCSLGLSGAFLPPFSCKGPVVMSGDRGSRIVSHLQVPNHARQCLVSSHHRRFGGWMRTGCCFAARVV